jgi:hypothetical protein
MRTHHAARGCRDNMKYAEFGAPTVRSAKMLVVFDPRSNYPRHSEDLMTHPMSPADATSNDSVTLFQGFSCACPMQRCL